MITELCQRCLLKRASGFLNAREVKNTEYQQKSHKSVSHSTQTQHKVKVRKQFHDNYFNMYRKNIKSYLNSRYHSVSMYRDLGQPTANIFHRITHALFQLGINMFAPLCKHPPKSVLVLLPPKAGEKQRKNIYFLHCNYLNPWLCCKKVGHFDH